MSKEELEQNPLLEEAEERPEPEEEYPEESFGNEEEEGDYGEDEREDYASAEDDFSLEDYMSDDDLSDYRLASSNASPDGESRDFVVSQGASFRESLIGQLGTRPLSDLEHKISEYIIGNIDDDGYLRRDVESIVDDLAFGVGVEVLEPLWLKEQLALLGREIYRANLEPDTLCQVCLDILEPSNRKETKAMDFSNMKFASPAGCLWRTRRPTVLRRTAAPARTTASTATSTGRSPPL